MSEHAAVRMRAPEARLRTEEDPYSEIVLVTPKLAEQWLATIYKQRDLMPVRVDAYDKSNRANEWKLNGESIKFDKEGCLMDGQHRLHAIIKSGVSVRTFVIWGLDREVMDTLDSGSNRTGASRLSIDGEENCSLLNSTIQMYYNISTESSSGRARLEHWERVRLLQAHPFLRPSVKWYKGISKNVTPKLFSPTGAAALYCHFWELSSAEEANSFLAPFLTGNNLQEATWQNYVRRALEKRDFRGWDKISVVVKGWNNHREGLDVTHIQFIKLPKVLKPV